MNRSEMAATENTFLFRVKKKFTGAITSDDIKRQTEQFLKNGGAIEVCEPLTYSDGTPAESYQFLFRAQLNEVGVLF